MGTLSDFVIATRDQAELIASSSAPTERWPGFAAEDLDLVKLALLLALATGRPFDVRQLITEIPLIHEQSDDGPWVHVLPSDLVEVLARADEQGRADLASKWAQADEFALDGWKLDAVADAVDQLCATARQAVEQKKDVLVWLSL